MYKKEKTIVKVNKLNFSGNMGMSNITVDKFPKEILKVDDWFGPQVGELCFNQKGELDIIKSIKWGDTCGGNYKPHLLASFEMSGDEVSYSSVIRVEVKKGRVFIFNNKPFVHQEPLDGGYIDKMAAGKVINNYEYEFGK